MGKKVTINEMHKLANEREGFCLSKDYLGNREKLKWKCKRDHTWMASPRSIKEGHWCRKCYEINKRLKIEDLQKIANQKGGKCLSKTYEPNKRIKWECSNKHTWKALGTKIKAGSWCPICAKNNLSLNIEELKKRAKTKHGKLISKSYKNANQKLIWECSEKHRWESKYSHVKNGSWCPKCAGVTKVTMEDANKLAEKMGGECISKSIINVKSLLKWRCFEGHEWEANYSNINNGKWCPECSKGFGERLVRLTFQKIFKRKFPSKKPKWLVNKDGNLMEFDGYNEKLGIAFEHQGEQHYRHVDYFHTKKQFSKRIRDDKEKAKLAKNFNVKLILIPEIRSKLHTNELLMFLEKEFKRLNIIPSHDISKIKLPIKEAYKSSIKDYLKTISKANKLKPNIDTYTTKYKSMSWICSEGHEFESPPKRIERGKSCYICSGEDKSRYYGSNNAEKMKYNITFFKELAKGKHGKCLSKEYKNIKTKLKWECLKGHKWEATALSILNNIWCPECSGKPSLNKAQELAKEKNGRCLTKTYINASSKMEWKCKNKHTWKATYTNIKRGTWCPKCNIESKRHGLSKAMKYATSMGGKCLSKKYINTTTKLKWECKNGHRWSTCYNNIMKGHWCPTCRKIDI